MLNSHKGLLDLVYQFLEHLVWEKEKTPLARKVNRYKIIERDDTFFFLFFKKVFRGHMSFFGATGTPVLDFW